MTRACPHCGAVAHFTEVWSESYGPNEPPFGAGIYARLCWLCDSCGLPVCGIYRTHAPLSEPTHIWPEVVMTKDFPDVPEAIATAASEAHQALGAFAPRAAVAMARSVIEATAKDKGITQGSVQAKINRLAGDGHISEAMREAAHEIRFAGNEAAHGDLVSEPISVEEASEVVELMDAILERVYQEPAKVARVRASREARRNGQGAGVS
jgi:hypothetical protein